MARYPLLGRPNPISDVFIAFCREHGFNFLDDLLPQFLQAFVDKGEDFEQIRGSVSGIYLDLQDSSCEVGHLLSF